jgi:hypothetical protein
MARNDPANNLKLDLFSSSAGDSLPQIVDE